MDSIHILVQGYAQKEPTGQYHASSTVVLVRSAGKVVLIDPGLYPKELKTALANEGLTTDDIDIVVFTHLHQDHTRNCNLFRKTQILDLLSKYRNLPEDMTIPQTEIKGIFTPGHTAKHISFLIDLPEGHYAVAGDVFWWEDSQDQKTDTASLLEHVDPVAVDNDSLKNSRKRLLSLADLIIPGHGKIFSVPEDMH